MRGTKVWLLVVVALAAACKSRATMAREVRDCSRISMDARGAAQCLVLQYKWKRPRADSAAAAYQRAQDSIAQFKADSAWRTDAPRHKRELNVCAGDPSGEVARCLVGFGWAEARGKATEDSLWRHDASTHRQQILGCTHRRNMQPGACLQLYYKWSPERALAVDDSIRRAKMRQ